jgi:1-deoxy-D-xylulose-5-phosphate reductoisomerase
LKNIAILGSTGSIGTQTLSIVDEKSDLNVVALSCGKNISLIEQQAKKYKPQIVCVSDEKDADILKENLKGLDIKVVYGMEGLIDAATVKSADIVVTAIVGMIGIRPTTAAIEAGKDIALANKETLVCAGHIIMPLAKEKNVKILPVDSEHSAIFQSLQGSNGADIEKILLTASGGPFRGKTYDELKNVTLEDALKHPNWSMGKKITIDSATMINKGLEVMEAHWLFDVPLSRIQITVHPQSILHSAVEFEDGAIIGQMGTPDMRLPIQYALSFPERLNSDFPRADLFALKDLTFEEPDLKRFPNLSLAYEAMHRGGNMPCVLNAANEVVNLAFREGRCGFLQMRGVEYLLVVQYHARL